MSTYADTSFLASLYVLDARSAPAAGRMKRAKLPLLITPFGELELTNAVALRLFRKELSASQGKAAHALIRKDLEDGVLMVKCVARERLRTGEADRTKANASFGYPNTRRTSRGLRTRLAGGHLLHLRHATSETGRGRRAACSLIQALEPRVKLKSGAVARRALIQNEKGLPECVLRASATGHGVRGRRRRRLDGDRQRRRDRSPLAVRG